jgi:hypothetical protein
LAGTRISRNSPHDPREVFGQVISCVGSRILYASSTSIPSFLGLEELQEVAVLQMDQDLASHSTCRDRVIQEVALRSISKLPSHVIIKICQLDGVYLGHIYKCVAEL